MNEEFINRLLSLYPEFDRVTGPYLRKDGRKHLCFNNTKLPNKHPNKKKTLSYPKALIEVKENRRLLDNETVDHIDRDFTNDDLTNLVIRDRSEHAKLDIIRRKATEVECIWCKSRFLLTRHQLDHRSKSGPFCSRKCSGEYGTAIQNRKINKLDRKKIEREYYLLDKS